jgi:large subunit ribosomal protein L4
MLSQLNTLPQWLVDGAEKNEGTLWQIVKAYRANRRQGTVGVKTRAMVASTGKKPYKQKKTGSARRGSFVSPLHVGGGVAHGPKARDYRQAIPTKMANVALQIALAHRVKAGKVFTGSIDIASGKTKDAWQLFKAVDEKAGKVLVCLANPSELTLRAVRNIRGVVLVKPEQITALDIVECRKLVATGEAMEILSRRLAN